MVYFKIGPLLQFKAQSWRGTAAVFLTTSFAEENWFPWGLHERQVGPTEHYFSCYNFSPLASQSNSQSSIYKHPIHQEPWVCGNKPKRHPLPSSTDQNTKPTVQRKSENMSHKQAYGLRYQKWRWEQNKI